MWTTYKFYDEKGRRLAIFCLQSADHLQITVIPCSQKDQFSKKRAKEIFAILDKDKWYRETYSIPIKDSKPKKTFIMWCQDNYYKRTPIVISYNGYGIAKLNYAHSVLPDKQRLGIIRPGYISTKLGGGVIYHGV